MTTQTNPFPLSNRPTPPKTPEQLEVLRQIRRLLFSVLAAIALFSSLSGLEWLAPSQPIAQLGSLLAFPLAISGVAYAVIDSLCGLLTLEGGLAEIRPSREFYSVLAASIVAAGMLHMSITVRNTDEWEGLRKNFTADRVAM